MKKGGVTESRAMAPLPLFDSPLLDPANNTHALARYPFFQLERNSSRRSLTFVDGDCTFTCKAVEGTNLPTIFDRDWLLYAISIIISKMDRGEEPSRTVMVSAHDFHRVTNRDSSSRSYSNMAAQIERLRGALVKTNIETGGQGATGFFNWLDTGTQINYDRENGQRRMVSVTLVLCDWLFRAIKLDAQNYRLPPDYFNLSPIDRRLYDLARANATPTWETSLGELQKYVGSDGHARNFKQAVSAASIPGYAVTLTDRYIQQEGRRGRPSSEHQIVVITQESHKKALTAQKPKAPALRRRKAARGHEGEVGTLL